MTIWRNKKNNRLYLLYENYVPYSGGLTAEPYGWSGKILFGINKKYYIKVGVR